ncbi:(2Fe-2S)-binding protein [Chthonobacter rhizosphaerae]|uniref:(2Fe-2S)-binding protein n=1 Tax=Chthonobacter rhizosphaerae TaxID=2735553 RepID=UPI0015EF4B5A|nr:hypothetical protein [Chthonobacter rhizosphaerae]
MIVCHCNVITLADIHSVVDELFDADPWRVITPGLVYMTLGKRGRCCGCFPNAVRVIEDRVASRRTAGDLPARSPSREPAEAPGVPATATVIKLRRSA